MQCRPAGRCGEGSANPRNTALFSCRRADGERGGVSIVRAPQAGDRYGDVLGRGRMRVMLLEREGALDHVEKTPLRHQRQLHSTPG
ncbi:uncharacterized protein K460DRAFT_4394 [Cucurbitaria berberidis CBS 394.84]|uniref:Uncharacterized protein n=1 Tax=Cucurbitaria berberidis CBS 394.84 TaxID=1168544 RepID=A0A9P4GQF8_9PLEO|nr:uncharacterized protein K460DRAFT_4394 [Cucurbitaria berberidis CBS 394.84]KAF1849825.1 hypothetical protein K460DRAFT_4394 [Cucurbitaria berberidis CBS 394.84]